MKIRGVEKLGALRNSVPHQADRPGPTLVERCKLCAQGPSVGSLSFLVIELAERVETLTAECNQLRKELWKGQEPDAL